MMFNRKQTTPDLDRLKAELGDLDADLAATDAQARELERRRTPGAGFDPSTKGGVDDTIRKLAGQRAALAARRSRVAPAVAALERLAGAQAKLPALLAAAQLPSDPAASAAVLDAAIGEATAAEAAARAVSDVAKARAGEAELARGSSVVRQDQTRAPRLRVLSDSAYREHDAAWRQRQALVEAKLALAELALLEVEAAQALANLDAKAKRAAA